MRIRRFIVSLLCITLAASAFALERRFPPAAKRGVMRLTGYPTIMLNGASRYMAPGVRIWNTENRTQLPSHIDNATDFIVNYTEDHGGQVNRVWILNAEEAAQTPEQQGIQSQSPQQSQQ